MHYHVLGLDESSTEDYAEKAYCNLDRKFYPDKNKHSQASDVMIVINKPKEEFEDTFCYNDAMREQERVRMAQYNIEI